MSEPTGWLRVRWELACLMGRIFWHIPYRIGKPNRLYYLTSRLTDWLLP